MRAIRCASTTTASTASADTGRNRSAGRRTAPPTGRCPARAPGRSVARLITRDEPAGRRDVFALLAVAAGALLLGGAMSFAQTVLPGPVAPIANSSSGWTAVAAALVFASRLRGRAAALAGAAALLLLVVGYVVTSDLRGFPDQEAFFLVAAVVVGPFAGWAAAALRERGNRAAVGAGLLAGVGLGDCLFGLLHDAGSTGPGYWIGCGVAAVLLLGVVLSRRSTPPPARLLGAGIALAVGAAEALAFTAL